MSIPRRKHSSPTVPAAPDPHVESFEARVAAAGEWRARLENLCAVVEDIDTAETKIMRETELEALRARCMHD